MRFSPPKKARKETAAVTERKGIKSTVPVQSCTKWPEAVRKVAQREKSRK